MPAPDPFGINSSYIATGEGHVNPGQATQSQPNVGPTGFWNRIAQIGIGKVNQLELAAKMAMAIHSRNPKAFRNADQANNQNNARIVSAETGNVGKAVQIGKAVVNDITNAPADIGKQIGKQVKSLSDPTNTQRGLPGGNQIVKNQNLALKNPEYIKAVKNIDPNTIPSEARIQAQQMAAKGAKAPEIAIYLSKQSKALSDQYTRGTGDLAQIVSLAVGGGEAKTATTGTKVVKGLKVASKTEVKLGTAGAVGNAGYTASTNPNATKKQLITSAGEGYIGGHVLGAASTLIGKGVDLLKKAPVDTPVASTANETPKPAQQKLLGAGTAPATKKETKQLTSGGQVQTSGEKSGTLKLYTPSVTKNQRVTAGQYPGVVSRDIKPITPETNPVKRAAAIKQAALDHADSTLAKVDNGKLSMSPDDRKALFHTRQAIANDKVKPLDTLPDSHPFKVAYAKVETPKEPSVSQPVSKPKTETPPTEKTMLPNTNKAPSKGTGGLITKVSNKLGMGGKVNPVAEAARQGHTDFADTAKEVAGRKVYALRQGNNMSHNFDTLYSNYLLKGGTHEQFIHEQFIKDVEAGNLGSEAHKEWVSIHSNVGKEMQSNGIIKGARGPSYVPRVGQFSSKGYAKGGSGLKKGGGFAKARVQGAVDEFGNSSDQFKTHADYVKFVQSNGGKALTDPRDILKHTLPSKLEAIQNAKGLNKLEKTQMSDGRPAVVTTGANSLPQKYSDYKSVDGLPGRAVHPDAAPTMKALTHTYSSEELNNPIAKTNSIAKLIVTLNGLVHGKNFSLAALRQMGAVRTARAAFGSGTEIGQRFGESNIERMIVKGGVVPFEQARQDIFDSIKNDATNPNLFKSAISKGFTPLTAFKEKTNNVLFNKLGNHLTAYTYFNTEKQFIKQGLKPDEAAKAAGAVARNVSFISNSVESSVEYRKTSRYVAFAGQYFKSTLNEAGRASGLFKDNTLSGAGQRAAQKQAIKSITRGMTYLLAMAQGINYATTGHSTFQNKDSKISPVFYVDKTTGKEYHITNWFGQLGDIMHLSNPQEYINKASPALQEIARVITGSDPYTQQTVRDRNASGVRQFGQIIGNSLQNLVSPFGFQISQNNRSTPSAVTGAKIFGYGASTVDQTQAEKDIARKYYATLPSGSSQAGQQLATLKAAARNDVSKGDTNSSNVQTLRSKMTSNQFRTFMKTAGENQTQRQFNALPYKDRQQIVNKYSSKQLQELNLSAAQLQKIRQYSPR